MYFCKVIYFLLIFTTLVLDSIYAGVLNPLSYRLRDAKTGIERYQALLRCHEDAVRKRAKVSYQGVDTIRIEIPYGFKTIPLTDETDFAGCVIIVVNKIKKVFLFSMVNEKRKIVVPASCIDNAQYSSIPELAKGNHLLVIADKNMWVKRRLGHDYGHVRRDVVLISDGKGSNKPVMPYDNSYSQAECECCEVSLKKKIIENLVFVRDSSSTEMCNLCEINYQNNVLIKNVSVTTPPKTGIIADRLFQIRNSTNIAFEDLNIKGTYSYFRKSGYAFYLVNVWNHTANNVYADAIWGVYGTHNLNTATLTNCNLNNFEIHCYGRDITSRNCTYHDYYNNFSSTYGTIRYDNCIFTNTVPHINESSYNAYVPVEVEFTNCIFNIKRMGKITSFARIYGFADNIKQRPELSKKCLPNFTICNCTFNIDNAIKKWYLINFKETGYKKTFDYISKIKISDVIINGNSEFDLFTSPIETEKQLDVTLDNVNVVTHGKRRRFHIASATMGKRIRMRCNGRKVQERKASRHNK